MSVSKIFTIALWFVACSIIHAQVQKIAWKEQVSDNKSVACELSFWPKQDLAHFLKKHASCVKGESIEKSLHAASGILRISIKNDTALVLYVPRILRLNETINIDIHKAPAVCMTLGVMLFLTLSLWTGLPVGSCIENGTIESELLQGNLFSLSRVRLPNGTFMAPSRSSNQESNIVYPNHELERFLVLPKDFDIELDLIKKDLSERISVQAKL